MTSPFALVKAVSSGFVRRRRVALTLGVVITVSMVAGSCGSGGVLDGYTDNSGTSQPAGVDASGDGATGIGGGAASPAQEGDAGTAQPEPSPADVLDSLLAGDIELSDLSPEWRFSMVYELWNEAVETDIVLELAADALDSEAENPTPGPSNTWFSESQVLMQAYGTSIPVDEYSIDQVRSRMASASPAARPWYLVAIGNSVAEGYIEDPTVGPDVVATLADNPDPAVAMHLMNLVGQLDLVDATDTLVAYLEDPLTYVAPDEPDQPPDYPLRDGAAGALRALGHTVYQPPDQPGSYVLFD